MYASLKIKKKHVTHISPDTEVSKNNLFYSENVSPPITPNWTPYKYWYILKSVSLYLADFKQFYICLTEYINWVMLLKYGSIY